MTTATNLATLEDAYSRGSSTKGGNVAEILDMFAETVEMRSFLDCARNERVRGHHVRQLSPSG